MVISLGGVARVVGFHDMDGFIYLYIWLAVGMESAT